MDKSAIIVNMLLEKKLVSVIINTGCLGIIISKGFMSRFRLVADSQVNFMLNTIEGTTKKQHLVFEKVKITVGKNSICLPVIVVDESYFNVLLRLAELRKLSPD